MAMVNKIKKGNVEKEIHDSRLPELTGEEGYCVPFVNDAGTAFQIGSIPAACLNTNCVTTEKVADSAITTDKINGGAVTEVKLGEEVLNRLPYGYNSERSHGVQRTSYHSRSASGEPASGQEGNYNLSGGAVWTHDVYNLHKQEFLASKPTYIILGCNILGFTSLHTPIHGSYLILNEVSRDFPTDNTDDLYEIVFEGVYDGFKYTYKEVFQHMVINGMSIISVPDSYTCKREFIAKTNTIADGAITTDKVANNAITKAKIDSTSAESIADHVIHATAVYENNELVASVEEDATTVMEWILDFDKTCAAMLTYDGVKYFLPCLYRADTSPDLEAIFGNSSVFFSSAGHGELTNLSLYVDVWVEDGEEPEIGEVRLKTSRQLLLAEDGAVEGRNIEDGAITGRKIANNTITRSKLADDALKWSNRPSGAGSANADQSKEAYLDDKTAIITGGDISAIDLYEAAPAGSTTYKIARHQYGSGSGIIDLALGASPTTDRHTLDDFYMSNLVVNGDFIVVNEITDDYIEIELSESLNPDSQIWRFNSERFPFEVHNFNKVNSLHIGTGITNDCILDGLVMGYAIDAGEHSSNARGIGSIIAGRFIQNCGNPRIINGEGIINGEYKGSVLIGENLRGFSPYATLIGLGHTSGRVPYITAFGKYSNITNDSQFVIGNGEDDTHRSNLFEIKTTGEVILGADPTGNMGAATKQYVDNAVATGGAAGNIIIMYADANAVQDCISDPTQSFSLYTDIELSSGYESLDEIPADGYFVCKPVMSGQVMTTIYPIGFSGGRYVSYILTNQNQNIVVVRGVLNQPDSDQ